MSIDIRDLSSGNVDRVARLLSRRPEYGIARPSRRWFQRQEVKIKSFPNELLDTSNFLKRLIIKLADNINPDAVDPRAVLCKVHSPLNPWLIRRLFLAVAYEVTVHSDTLRSWKGKKDVPGLSAFVGRIDAVAALWTAPDLYRQCYGTPPFESHMVFVKSGCEACILAAVGANARVLADLRAILIDRIERRSPRRDGRPANEPRLIRYIESWIHYLQEERATKCLARSDNVLAELRNARPQLIQWRNWRRRQHRSSRASGTAMYSELKRSNRGDRLTPVPAHASHSRRTRDGIPMAMADREDAEERRRAAMYSLQDEESIYRPDSMNPLAEAGPPAIFRYDAMSEQDPETPYDADPYGTYEERDEDELERTLGQEEDGRSHVGDWYADRLTISRADLTADDRRSVLSTIHPAFQPTQRSTPDVSRRDQQHAGSPRDRFTHGSAVPPPLGLGGNGANRRRSASTQRFDNRASVWTDVTVHTDSTHTASPRMGDAPPIPRVPSEYRRRESTSSRDHHHHHNDGGARQSSSTTTRRPSAARPSRPRQNSAPSIAASSVYSDHPALLSPLSPLSPRTRAVSPGGGGGRASSSRGGPPLSFWNRNRRYLRGSSSTTSPSNSRPSTSSPRTNNNSLYSQQQQQQQQHQSHHQSRNQQRGGVMRSYAAEDNPFGRRGGTTNNNNNNNNNNRRTSASRSQGGGGGSGGEGRRSQSVGGGGAGGAPRPPPPPPRTPSLTRSESAYHGDNDTETDDDPEAFFGPPTPRASSYAGGLGANAISRAAAAAADEWRPARVEDEDDDEVGNITPWPSFYRRPEGDKYT
ncbi:hypothetical protein Hte_011382 [Hypoxylon texense]